MDERKFYDERQETKQLTLICPHCRQENTYPIRWILRTKKAQLPRGASEEDAARKRCDCHGDRDDGAR